MNLFLRGRHYAAERDAVYNDYLTTANEAQVIPYFDRVSFYGEAAALVGQDTNR
jgi:hypothetical protein